jgi:hypothetical protein
MTWFFLPKTSLQFSSSQKSRYFGLFQHPTRQGDCPNQPKICAKKSIRWGWVERQEYHRFCHNLDKVVQELEVEWEAAVDAATQSTESKNSS